MARSFRAALAAALVLALLFSHAHAQEDDGGAPAAEERGAGGGGGDDGDDGEGRDGGGGGTADEDGQAAAAGDAGETGPERMEDGRKPLTQDEARRLFLDMGRRAASEGFSPDYTDDGCFYKARMYEAAARDFVRDDGTKLSDEEINRIHYVPGRDTNLGWNYHTTVTLPVLDDSGRPQEMVFDPALFPAGPQDIDTWAQRTGRDNPYDWADGDKRRPRERSDAYVTVVPNSHVQPANTIPPAYGRVNDERTVRETRGWAEDIFSGAYRGNTEARYRWNNEPREPVRLVFGRRSY